VIAFAPRALHGRVPWPKAGEHAIGLRCQAPRSLLRIHGNARAPRSHRARTNRIAPLRGDRATAGFRTSVSALGRPSRAMTKAQDSQPSRVAHPSPIITIAYIMPYQIWSWTAVTPPGDMTGSF
jgi:hypothetical protein